MSKNSKSTTELEKKLAKANDKFTNLLGRSAKIISEETNKAKESLKVVTGGLAEQARGAMSDIADKVGVVAEDFASKTVEASNKVGVFAGEKLGDLADKGAKYVSEASELAGEKLGDFASKAAKATDDAVKNAFEAVEAASNAVMDRISQKKILGEIKDISSALVEDEELRKRINNASPEQLAALEKSMARLQVLSRRDSFLAGMREKDSKIISNILNELDNNDKNKLITDFLERVLQDKVSYFTLDPDHLKIIKDLNYDVHEKYHKDRSIFELAAENNKLGELVLMDKVFPRKGNEEIIAEVDERVSDKSAMRIEVGHSGSEHIANVKGQPSSPSSVTAVPFLENKQQTGVVK